MRDKMGHQPMTTVRDLVDSFSQVGGSFRAKKLNDSFQSIDGGSNSDNLCQDSLLMFTSRNELRDISIENQSLNESFEKKTLNKDKTKSSKFGKNSHLPLNVNSINQTDNLN